MKKIKKASELLWVLGIIFVAFGVAICSKADLGVSMIAAPPFVVYEFIAPFWSGFSVGMTEYLIQGIMLVVLCVAVRKFNWTYILAFLVAVIYGYTLNLFLWLLSGLEFTAVWQRWAGLLIGDCITAAGVACFFRTYMPLQVYELFVAEISAVFGKDINRVKKTFDRTLLILSVILALVLFRDASRFDWSTIGYRSFHSLGLGTLVTTLINSPIIKFIGNNVIDKLFGSEAAFPRLEKLLKR